MKAYGIILDFLFFQGQSSNKDAFAAQWVGIVLLQPLFRFPKGLQLVWK